MIMQKRVPGFSFLEILMALAIMAMIIAATVPIILNRKKAADKAATALSMKNIQQSVELFRSDVGQYPEKLKDLAVMPKDEEIASNWNKHLNEVPKDGWGREFKYRLTPDADNPYELHSYGPKGKKAPKSEWMNVWKLK